ncbi:MAG: PAS domain-containing protein [Sphingosinicella sp.]|nr:PAS domain-containing protein [Sphingosinicella sp.]
MNFPTAPDEAALFASIAMSPIATVISNPRRPDNPIVAANAAFCGLTGYDQSEIVGRNCRFLAGENTEPWLTERVREAIRSLSPSLVELLNYKKDGSPFRNAVLIAPIFDDDGKVAWFLGSQVEVGDGADAPLEFRQRRAEQLVNKLPPRQRQVLGQMAGGYRNKQIAWRLSLSEKTVKMHRQLLLGNLGVSTTADAIRIAVEAGF